MTKKRILLPLDGSPASLKAYIPAKSLSELLNLPLCILHVSEKLHSISKLREKLNISKEDLKHFILSHQTGNPADIILEESKNSAYIVMGTHGKTCDVSLKAGSVTLTVIENTFKPVLLIRPEIELKIKDNLWIPQKTLIPLNGAPNSSQALTPVIELLAEINAEIDLLHITCSNTNPPSEEGSLITPYYTDYQQHEWASWSSEFLKRFCLVLQDCNHIKINLSVAHGEPSKEILNFAGTNNNDFISIAWHGSFSELRASVVKKILLEAPCPIMLIKIKD